MQLAFKQSNLPSNSVVVAAFDFDNTLTDRDSFLPFLFYSSGFFKTIGYLFILLPFFIAFAMRYYPREKVKERIITRFFKGIPYEHLEALGKKYAATQLDRYLKPEGLKKLKWHQAQNHSCILVSAAPEFYLRSWGERYGFEATLATKLQVNSEKLVTGHLEGINCWGPEKVRRLTELLGSKNYILYAYGDSRGDQELLYMADYPFYRHF